MTGLIINRLCYSASCHTVLPIGAETSVRINELLSSRVLLEQPDSSPIDPQLGERKIGHVIFLGKMSHPRF